MYLSYTEQAGRGEFAVGVLDIPRYARQGDAVVFEDRKGHCYVYRGLLNVPGRTPNGAFSEN